MARVTVTEEAAGTVDAASARSVLKAAHRAERNRRHNDQAKKLALSFTLADLENADVVISESKMRRQQMEQDRLDKLARDKEEMQRIAKEKKAASRARILLYHNKIKQDYQHSSMRLRAQRLARISRHGASDVLEVTL